jgi:hypothetical protein
MLLRRARVSVAQVAPEKFELRLRFGGPTVKGRALRKKRHPR